MQTTLIFADERAYTTAEVASATGLSLRQLDYWARKGHFVPTLKTASKQGSRRHYNFVDVVELRFINTLLLGSWTLRESFEALGACRAILRNPDLIEDAVFIQEGKKLLAVCKTLDGKRLFIDAAKAGGQQVMEIGIEVLQAETLEHLSRIK